MIAAVAFGLADCQRILKSDPSGVSGEYTARSFRTACARCGITQSMGRPGPARRWTTRSSSPGTPRWSSSCAGSSSSPPRPRPGSGAWIEDYNRDRRHSALGMRSPLDYECALREQAPEAA
jgi:putative transposase